MSFVPTTVVPPPTPSAQAKELSGRLAATIDRFRQENPTITPAEIRQAIDLAMPGHGIRGPGLVSALAMGCLIFGALIFLYVARDGLDCGGQPLMLTTLAGTGVVALAILALALKKR